VLVSFPLQSLPPLLLLRLLQEPLVVEALEICRASGLRSRQVGLWLLEEALLLMLLLLSLVEVLRLAIEPVVEVFSGQPREPFVCLLMLR